ncbi:MAG: hypothetical protein ACC656_11405 [Candidatus Heimdallarchaeota archaeon]
MGQGNACCRYLIVGGSGFECAKFTEHKNLLDFRSVNGTMTAQSDNCDGYSTEESLLVLNQTEKTNC